MAAAALDVVPQVLPPQAVLLRPVAYVTPTPGLARPPWSDVTLGREVTASGTPGPAAVREARSLLRAFNFPFRQ